MGDLTGEYFARIKFIEGVEWLSEFEPIPSEVGKYLTEQKKKVEKMKQKFDKIKFSRYKK